MRSSLHIEPEAAGPTAVRRGIAGKVGVSVFLLVFAVMGLLVVALLVREAVLDVRPRSWTPAAATVLTSRVVATDDDESPYRLEIRYRYAFAGRELIGDRARRRASTSHSYDTVEETARRYPEGSVATCYVDPTTPEQAVLERTLPTSVLVIPLPLVFVAFGLGGLAAVWRRRPIVKARTAAISAGAGSRSAGRRAAVAIGVLFVAVGGALLVALGILPALRLAEAHRWTEVPCTIISSTVRSYDSDDGTTYRVDILYEYQVDDVTHRSNRLDFLGFASSGFESKADVVTRYPAGSAATCWVDPDDPYRSVLDPKPRLPYLVGLAPLLFVIPGAAVMRWGLAVPGRRHDLQHGAAAASAGTRRLHPKASPAAKLVGSVIFALMWNGIVSVFVWQAVDGWRRGEPDWFLTLFLTPFVLIGATSLLLVVYSTLALANPRPRVEVEPGVIHLGERLMVSWSLAGPAGRIERLEIVLEGREEVDRSSGKSARTIRSPFIRLTVVAAEGAVAAEPGAATVSIPEDSMHSLDAPGHRIVWTLRLHGSIPSWPDVDEEFPIEVLPTAVERSDRA